MPMPGNLNDRFNAAFRQTNPNNDDGDPLLSVDPRGYLTGTQWPLTTASGSLLVASLPPAGTRWNIFAIMMTPVGTLDARIQSPSGTDLTGTLHLTAGGQFAQCIDVPAYLLRGALNGEIVVTSAGSLGIGGWLSAFPE